MDADVLRGVTGGAHVLGRSVVVQRCRARAMRTVHGRLRSPRSVSAHRRRARRARPRHSVISCCLGRAVDVWHRRIGNTLLYALWHRRNHRARRG